MAKRTPHPLHKTWSRMIDRCTNLRAHNYRWYGATGIKVCQRWLVSFDAFAIDVGDRPQGHTLDRWPDKHGNYEPGNVRWASKLEQGNNARNNLLHSIDGDTKTLKEWSRHYGINYLQLYNRVRRGHDLVLTCAVLVAANGVRLERADSKRPLVKALLLAGQTTTQIQEATGAKASCISVCRKHLGLGRNSHGEKRPTRQ